MEQIEEGKVICEMIEQLIDKNDNFLNNKAKLYCEYCLSLNKEYVDSINSNLYEDCKNYFSKKDCKNLVVMKKKKDMRNLRITGI